MMSAGMIGIAAVFAFGPTGEFAAPPPRVHGVSQSLGLASALGFGGVSYEREFAPVFRVEVGLGFGRTGLQLALMPAVFWRFYPPFSAFVAAGPSLAHPFRSAFGVLTWGNIEGGFEFARGDFFFRSAVGATILVRGSFEGTCIHCMVGDQNIHEPYARFPALRGVVGRRF